MKQDNEKHLSLRALPVSDQLDLNVGTLHFVGIGGIGMSGIAEVLHNLGYKVQGSDAQESYNTQRLKEKGIKVLIGQNEKNIEDVSVLVISSAIKADNPELAAARAARIPVVKRAEMLAELMRFKISIAVAGTHGKTTTTALTASLLETAEYHPTVINGGIINARGTNAYLGKGKWMVVEADESDGTFMRLPATIAVITNIDPEHLDHYGSFDNAKAAFQTFLTNLPFYGFAVLCIDHPEVQALAGRINDRRIITYGTNPQADIRAFNIRSGPEGECYDVEVAGKGNEPSRIIKDIMLPMHGHHNIRNSMVSVVIAQELKLPDEVMLKALRSFEGVKRRFTKTGKGLGVTVVDDYAHHPVEIAATLKAARAAQSGDNGGKVIAVVQPHRYTRVRDLFNDFCTCFNDADTVIVTDIYSAGEEPLEDITPEKLVEGLQGAGHRHVLKLESQEALPETIASVAQKGDMAVCMGAGSITKWAYELPAQLKALENKKAAS